MTENDQLIADLRDLGYTPDLGVDFRLDVLTLDVLLCAKVDLAGRDRDEALWLDFVRYRKLLAKDGFRLTGAHFEGDSFWATVMRSNEALPR